MDGWPTKRIEEMNQMYNFIISNICETCLSNNNVIKCDGYEWKSTGNFRAPLEALEVLELLSNNMFDSSIDSSFERNFVDQVSI